MPTTFLLAPPDFQTFLRPYLGGGGKLIDWGHTTSQVSKPLHGMSHWKYVPSSFIYSEKAPFIELFEF